MDTPMSEFDIDTSVPDQDRCASQLEFVEPQADGPGFSDDEAFAVQLLLTSLGEHSGACVCALTIAAKALSDPAMTREAVASALADWLYAEFGSVAAAAFDLLAGIACQTPVSEADTLEVLYCGSSLVPSDSEGSQVH